MKFLLQKFRPRKAFQFSCCVQLRQRLPLHGTGYDCLGGILISPIFQSLFHDKTKARLGAERLRALRAGLVGRGGINSVLELAELRGSPWSREVSIPE